MSTGSGCSVSTSTAVPGQARARQSGYEPKLASDGSKIQEPGFLEANPATALGECASERLAGVGEDDLVHVLVPAEVVVLVVAGQEDHLLASRRAPYELEEPFRLPNAYFTPRTEVEDIAEQDEFVNFLGVRPQARQQRGAPAPGHRSAAPKCMSELASARLVDYVRPPDAPVTWRPCYASRRRGVTLMSWPPPRRSRLFPCWSSPSFGRRPGGGLWPALLSSSASLAGRGDH